MKYAWNKLKAQGNIQKHGVDFADAVIALEDENALTIEDENALTIEDDDADEQRFKTLGMGAILKILFVVHAEQDEDCIRIISARKADSKEVKQYYKGLNYE